MKRKLTTDRPPKLVVVLSCCFVVAVSLAVAIEAAISSQEISPQRTRRQVLRQPASDSGRLEVGVQAAGRPVRPSAVSVSANVASTDSQAISDLREPQLDASASGSGQAPELPAASSSSAGSGAATSVLAQRPATRPVRRKRPTTTRRPSKQQDSNDNYESDHHRGSMMEEDEDEEECYEDDDGDEAYDYRSMFHQPMRQFSRLMNNAFDRMSAAYGK